MPVRATLYARLLISDATLLSAEFEFEIRRLRYARYITTRGHITRAPPNIMRE